MKVELIYFPGCPNIELARQRLTGAFAAAGLPPHWQEWDRDDALSPAYTRTWGSPTILVDGRDVAGVPPADHEAGTCRVYVRAEGGFDGAPAETDIVNALREASPRGGWRGAAAALPAIGTAALPKLACPACWPAYSGLLSAAGIGFVDYTPYLFPLTAFFLALSLVALGWRAKRRRGFAPLALGVLASLLILVGKFDFDSDLAMYLGMTLLVGATLWNAWPRGRAAGNCPA